MTGLRWLLIISVVVALWTPSVTPSWAVGHRPDEILVRYRAGMRAAVSASARASGMQVRKTIDRIRFHVLKVPAGQTVEQALKRIKSDPNVEYAGPNHTLRICAPQVWPNDPVFYDGYDLLEMGIFIMPNQLGLYNDGYNLEYGGTYRADIKAPEAWAITTGSPNVTIAVLDTGVDHTHPDLACSGKVLPGYNAVTGGTYAMDDNGHGTFVAGIAAACSNNGIGIAGVAWNSRILPVKVISSDGMGDEADAADGTIWAVDQGAKILNMSFATDINLPALEQAIEYAWSHGCLPVCATGNEGSGIPLWPSAYVHTLAVGATNEYDQRCTSSDWGAGGSNFGPHIDVMAPGNNITSTWSDPEPLIGQVYYASPGTSAATPFVSGIAALIWSIHPDWTNQKIFDQIIHTADDKGAVGWDQYYGWGRANAYRALTEEVSSDPIPSIGVLKTRSEGTYAQLTGKVITAGTAQISNMVYVEEPDRTSGIMAYFPSGVPSGFVLGDRVNVAGTLSKRNGELVLTGATLTKTSSGTQLRPLGISGKQTVGPTAGMLRGLLVKVWGTVTEVGWDYFYVDDGSGLLDSLGAFPGIRVSVPSTTLVPGNRVAAIGLLGMDQPSGATSPLPVIRPRRPADISVISTQ